MLNEGRFGIIGLFCVGENECCSVPTFESGSNWTLVFWTVLKFLIHTHNILTWAKLPKNKTVKG